LLISIVSKKHFF